MRLAVIALLALFPFAAQAGSFCVAGYGLPPQCLYDDIRVCQQASTPPATDCVINPDAPLNQTGGTEYCVVNSQLIAQCLYTDRNQCVGAAQRASSICVDLRSLNQPYNPFRYDNRIQN